MNGFAFNSLMAQMPQINQIIGKEPLKRINVCYAVVIGIHRIILFDNFNNVQGFIVNGSVISVNDAGPELTAFILEPLRVSNPTETNYTPESPTLSTMSGTTTSEINPAYNNAHENKDESLTDEETPEPPISSLLSLLSAPAYVPSPSKDDEKQKINNNNNNNNNGNSGDIISIVGDRIVTIPPISSLKTDVIDVIKSSYYNHSKRNLKNSGLKRSRTTFQCKKPKKQKKAIKSRSLSCGALSVVEE